MNRLVSKKEMTIHPVGNLDHHLKVRDHCQNEMNHLVSEKEKEMTTHPIGDLDHHLEVRRQCQKEMNHLVSEKEITTHPVGDLDHHLEVRRQYQKEMKEMKNMGIQMPTELPLVDKQILVGPVLI